MESYPYANAVGSIMYAMISIRPDLAFSISVLSSFMPNLGYDHQLAIKWAIPYIVGTSNVGLCYRRTHVPPDFVGYVDADFACGGNSKNSTTSFMFTLTSNQIEIGFAVSSNPFHSWV